MAIHRRRTGSAGFRGLGGKPGSAEWIGGLVFGSSLVLAGLAPVLQLTGALEPIAALDRARFHAAGLVLGGLGMLGTFATQQAMGASWRMGVDEAERTELVTDGVFGLVRNPIYTTMFPAMAGLLLLVPNASAVAALAALSIGLELQVRFGEEPYLLRTHGDAYRAYAARVGRFVPGIGRLDFPRPPWR